MCLYEVHFWAVMGKNKLCRYSIKPDSVQCCYCNLKLIEIIEGN